MLIKNYFSRLFLLSILLLSSAASAQDWQWGIRGGRVSKHNRFATKIKAVIKKLTFI